MDFIFEYWLELVFGVGASALSYVFRQIFKRLTDYQREIEFMKHGLMSLLRNRIIDCHDKYSLRGYIPIYALDDATEMYKSYKSLGGNGTVTKLYGEIMELPNKPGGWSKDEK